VIAEVTDPPAAPMLMVVPRNDEAVIALVGIERRFVRAVRHGIHPFDVEMLRAKP
jgi:hypothetical protein